MQIQIDWHEDCLEYRREKGLEDDLASRAALTLRLAMLFGDYNRLTQAGQHDEAACLVRWLVVPSHFVLRDPDTGQRYECVQGEDGTIRVVAGYEPEEVDLDPREMPEVQ